MPLPKTTPDASSREEGGKGVLERAADLLAKHGAWSRGGENCVPGTLCLGQAMEQAGEGCLAADKAAAYKALYAVAPFSDLSGLIRWNDAANSSQRKVLALIRKAAKP